ncbi:C2 domain protein (macronuclear) [Tetrahymena thermophila SB210]|uniref:Ferlin 2 n=1 Tax=Tetrahymena thermophila (strain SB210) TaxID=312017 RepID=FER2_TETTS|nr:C2 domain protein [Tetrahymena thermophila SB210]EAR93381.2 C2 domain protein [Tetrahymena thermophila SB210]|eukprot:XP_001013626.2 C2 domain protein [Tetrahymena thermophila SB210]
MAQIASGVNEIKSNLGDIRKLINQNAQYDQKKEYQVQVTIIEARGLIAKDADGSDPYVKIFVGKLPPQVTNTKSNASTVVFNQSFTFKDLFLNQIELENQEITLQVIDQNQFATNPLIGQQSIGLSTLYRSNNHEFFKTWLTLIHPDQGIEPQGYLLVSCYIIGTEDRPPVHDINEAKEDDDDGCSFLNIPDEELNDEQRKKKAIWKQPVVPINMPLNKREQYQLLVSIVKGEDLPILTGSTCDSFIACRVGSNVLRTMTVKNSQKPNFQTKMVFPVFFPVYNDKIVIRVWDSRTLRSDNFIAAIPEKPNENDWFNINTLHSRGGTMSFRWFHLYGVPLPERPEGMIDEVVKKLTKQVEGTMYMGRILLSLSLSPNEKAELGLQSLGGYKEPPILKYIIRCDTFELQSSFDCGQYIMIEINFGGQVIRSNLCQKRVDSHEKQKNNQQSSRTRELNQYIWKDSKSQIKDELQIDIPFDQSQQPDVIVSLYSVTPNKKTLDYDVGDMKRQAYIRIKPTSRELEHEQPKWYQLKPVKYKTIQEVHSHLLMNVELKTEMVAKQKTRHPIKRSLKQMYQFKGYLWGGYDLLPSHHSDDTCIKAQLQIGTRIIDVVTGRKGKNVIWNHSLEFLIELDEKLEFSSNILVSFYNKKSSDEEFIGQIAIKAVACEVKIDNKQINIPPPKPKYQFYHIVQEGKSNGRILAAFQLQRSEKTFNQNNDVNEPKYDKILKDQDFKYVQVKFPLIGVRNLPEGIRDPEFVFRIPQPDLKFVITLEERKQRKELTRNYYYEKIITLKNNEEEQEQAEQKKTIGGKIFTMIAEQQKVALKNINFCTILENDISECLKIPVDLQFTPILELEIRDRAAAIKTVRYHSSISLIDYIPWGDVGTKNAKIEFFEIGKLNLMLLQDEDQDAVQNQFNDDDEGDNEDEQDSRENDFDDNRDANLIFTEQFREEVDQQNQNSDDKRRLLSNKNLDKLDGDDQPQSLKNLQNLDSLSKADQKSQFDLKSESKSRATGKTKTSKKSTSSTARKLLLQQKLFESTQTFFNAEFNPSVEFTKSLIDEANFKLEREQKIQKLADLVFELKKMKKKDEGREKQLLREIEDLKNYLVKENIFLEQGDDGAQENFDYGREIVRVPLQDQLEKGLPYKKFRLYMYGNNTHDIGIPTAAVIKAHLKVLEHDIEIIKQRKTQIRETLKNKSNRSSMSLSMRSSIQSNTFKSSRKTSRSQKLGENKPLVSYECEGDDQRFPFDIFKKTFLEFFQKQFELKTRVYLLRCTNISAQASKIEAYHLLAGEAAVCSASSYPWVIVGDGENRGKNIIKNIKDDANIAVDTLNPEFFKMYELDATLPEDWNLVVKIMNKGTAIDALIGQFEIDLEDRVLGQKELRRRIAYQTYIEYFREKCEQYKYNYEIGDKKKNYEIKINELITKIEALDRNLKLPVEYLELKHPEKNTCQGTIEFFLEPFPFDVARIIPPSTIEKPQPMEFEIRLIIWETFDIPISNPIQKSTVDIFLTVSLDSTANIKGEEIVKETDVHFGSENGNGVFNYRMVFPLVIPCSFPRLRLQVSDFSTVGSNESLGETVITLRKALKKLKEGIVFQMPTTKFKFEHPNYPGQDRGCVSISMKIINKQAAESDPVGEGQNEPNKDPILEKPKEGRNVGDFLKGTALDFSAWSFFGLTALKYFAGIFVSIVTMMILFVKPGILVN